MITTLVLTHALRALGGVSAFAGDLDGTERHPTVLVGVRRPFEDGAVALSFDVLRTEAMQRRGAFPYDRGDRLDVLAFLLLPQLCGEARAGTEVCGGIGLGTVNVNTEGDRQDYGTWHYEAAARQDLTAALQLEVAAKYIGKIEQTREGDDAAFWLVTYGAGISWKP